MAVDDILKLTGARTAQDIQPDRALWDLVDSGDLEVYFIRVDRDDQVECYVDALYTAKEANCYRLYYKARGGERKSLLVEADFQLFVVPSRVDIRVLELRMADLPFMIVESLHGVQEDLECFFGEGDEWQDFKDGATLTITVKTMSRKEIAELGEWEP